MLIKRLDIVRGSIPTIRPSTVSSLYHFLSNLCAFLLEMRLSECAFYLNNGYWHRNIVLILAITWEQPLVDFIQNCLVQLNNVRCMGVIVTTTINRTFILPLRDKQHLM